MLSKLRSQVRGQVYVPSDLGYQASIALDNGRICRNPMVVVYPYDIQDIRIVISIAQAYKCKLNVKSGGHSYSGYCLNDSGIVLDLQKLNRIFFTNEGNAINVEMGARWDDIYSFLAKNAPGMTIVGGTCLSVGVAGFLLGGGYSFLSRSYGLGSDNILCLCIITADGILRTISANSTGAEHDLFWACLGGGGGNFGVVVTASLRLHCSPTPTIMGGTLVYPLNKAREVLSFYNEWIKTVPDELAVYGYMGFLPNPINKRELDLSLRLQPVFNGSFEDGQRLIQPLMNFVPQEFHFYNLSFYEYLLICDRCTSINGRHSYIRSGIFPLGGLKENVISIFEEFMRKAPSKESFMLWMHQGGKTNTFKREDSAYPHRDAIFIFEAVAIWEKKHDPCKNIEWAYRFAEALRPEFIGAYINYIDPLLIDWQQMYYGSNYERLCAIKKHWDPSNFFNFQQSIGTKYYPDHSSSLDLDSLTKT